MAELPPNQPLSVSDSGPDTHAYPRGVAGAQRDQKRKSEEIKDVDWVVQDSPLESFAFSFRDVLPQGYDVDEHAFTRYIEDSLKHEQHNKLAAIEFGGVGSALFQGFSRNLFSLTIGVSLKDARISSAQINDDTRRNHEVLEGDIFSQSLYRELSKRLAGKEVGLIISRMYGGRNNIGDNPGMLAIIGRKWYKLLKCGGIMFVDWLPTAGIQYGRKMMMNDWIDYIQKNFSDTLEVQVDESCFRLVKKEGAPEKLPTLP